MRKRESVDNQFGFNITSYEKTAFSVGERDAVMDVSLSIWTQCLKYAK